MNQRQFSRTRSNGRPCAAPGAWLLASLLWLLATGAGGCAGTAPTVAQQWLEGPEGGQILLTPHYALHTTIADPAFQHRLAETMEASRRHYAQLAPLPDRAGEDRLRGFIFAYRDEWAEFTSQTTGPTAAVYLQIHRGGYAHGDAFATFYHGGPQTLSVCRHEGWHQYVATGFRRRPPPFLEEGIATLFEQGFDNDHVAYPRLNPTRQLRLIEAVRRQRAWPLRQLLSMHAGDVIGTDWRQVDTFYAQAWALAHFLASDPHYQPGFRRLLAAYADGSVGQRPTAEVFETAFGRPFARIEADYHAHVLKLTGKVPGRRIGAE